MWPLAIVALAVAVAAGYMYLRNTTQYRGLSSEQIKDLELLNFFLRELEGRETECGSAVSVEEIRGLRNEYRNKIVTLASKYGIKDKEQSIEGLAREIRQKIEEYRNT